MGDSASFFRVHVGANFGFHCGLLDRGAYIRITHRHRSRSDWSQILGRARRNISLNRTPRMFDGRGRNLQFVWLAIAWVVVNGGSSIGASAARKYSHWSASRLFKLDAFLVVVHSVALMSCAFLGSSMLFLSVLFFAHLVVTGSDGPLRSIAINKVYDGNYRTSLLSVFSMVENLGGLFGLLLIDVVTKYAHASVPIDWALPAILMGAPAPLGFVAARRANRGVLAED